MLPHARFCLCGRRQWRWWTLFIMITCDILWSLQTLMWSSVELPYMYQVCPGCCIHSTSISFYLSPIHILLSGQFVNFGASVVPGERTQSPYLSVIYFNWKLWERMFLSTFSPSQIVSNSPLCTYGTISLSSHQLMGAIHWSHVWAFVDSTTGNQKGQCYCCRWNNFLWTWCYG